MEESWESAQPGKDELISPDQIGLVIGHFQHMQQLHEMSPEPLELEDEVMDSHRLLSYAAAQMEADGKPTARFRLLFSGVTLAATRLYKNSQGIIEELVEKAGLDANDLPVIHSYLDYLKNISISDFPGPEDYHKEIDRQLAVVRSYASDRSGREAVLAVALAAAWSYSQNDSLLERIGKVFN